MTKKNNKMNIRAVYNLCDIAARSIAVYFLLEPLFMAESTIVRGLMGAAIVWMTIGVAEFVYKLVIVPSAQAINDM